MAEFRRQYVLKTAWMNGKEVLVCVPNMCACFVIINGGRGEYIKAISPVKEPSLVMFNFPP